MFRIVNVGIKLLQIVGDIVIFYCMICCLVLSCLFVQIGFGDLQGVGEIVGDEGGV